MARSRFTLLPTDNFPRLVRRNVCGIMSAVKLSDEDDATVRHTPFTAILEPDNSFCSNTLDALTVILPPDNADTVPISSTIPVNITPPFYL